MFNVDKFNEINKILKKYSNSGKIIAISKNHPLESVLEAIRQGVYIFGENRVQEAQIKFLKIKQNDTIVYVSRRETYSCLHASKSFIL